MIIAGSRCYTGEAWEEIQLFGDTDSWNKYQSLVMEEGKISKLNSITPGSPQGAVGQLSLKTLWYCLWVGLGWSLCILSTSGYSVITPFHFLPLDAISQALFNAAGHHQEPLHKHKSSVSSDQSCSPPEKWRQLMVLPNCSLKMIFYWSFPLCCEPQEQEGNHRTLRSEFNFGVTQSTLNSSC